MYLALGCKPRVFESASAKLIEFDAPVSSVKPENKPTYVILHGDRLKITEKIAFEYDSPNISSSSDQLLRAIADFMLEHEELRIIRVEGHASSDGDFDYNMRLSNDRAEAVVERLVALGVARSRLVAKGFGSTQPLVTGGTEQAHAKNRRVEFIIIDQIPRFRTEVVE